MPENVEESGVTPVVESPPAQEPTELPESVKKALSEERNARRDAEKQLKAQTAELAKFREASMSDQEKAVAAAVEQARAAAFLEVAADRVDDAVRVAAAGRPVDVDSLLEGLDRARFLTEQGRPDVERIGEWVDRISPANDGPPPFPDLGQGTRPDAALALNGDPLLRDLKAKLGVR